MASKEKKLPEKQNDGSKSELMRRFKSNPFVFIGTFIVLIIIIIAFVMVPALGPGTAMNADDLTFGYYNKVPITYATDNYFYNWQQMLARYYQSSMDDNNYIFIVNQIWSQAYMEAVIHAGKLDEMKQAGYIVPEDRVDREVALLPRYQENGRFSVSRYRRDDNNTRMNLWRLTREEITSSVYSSDYESLVPVPGESAFISSMVSPQRRFDMVSFSIGSYPDSEVLSFAAENSRLFTINQLSRITVNSSEREARQILASIENGVMTFEDVARASSQDIDSERGGDMGSRMAYELEFIIPGESDREEVANLTQGRLSGVIQVGERSWAFFRADENPRPADTDDYATLDKIRSYVFSYERGIVEDWLYAEAEKFVFEANEWGFDSVVANSYMQKQNFGPIPVNYGDLDLFPSLASSGVQEIQQAGRNEEFWRIAFSTPIRTVSIPVVIGNNIVVLYPLEETISDDDYYIESYFRSVLSRHTDDAIRTYFLTNSKFDDRFAEAFMKNWGY